MATKVTTFLIDDIDGSTAAATVSFRIHGEDYEIDLSAANTAALRKLLDPYMAAGRVKDARAAAQCRRTNRGRGEPKILPVSVNGRSETDSQ